MGPFQYVAGSQPGGPYADAWGWQPLGQNYPTEEELETRIPASAVQTFTGPGGHAPLLQHGRLPPRRVLDDEAARARDGDVLVAGLARVADRAELHVHGRARRARPGRAVRAQLRRSAALHLPDRSASDDARGETEARGSAKYDDGAMASEQAEASGADADAGSPVRLVAFYLPQFHPIPENDLWWGQGFTEWTNVVPRARPVQRPLPTAAPDRARVLRPPRPRGARPPGRARARVRRPRLLLPPLLVQRAARARAPARADARARHADAALLHLAGRTRTGRGAGTGSSTRCSCARTTTGDWAERFIRDALPILGDDRYIRVGGAALLLVYRVDLLPDAPRVAELWRTIAQAEGLDLHLAAVQSFEIEDPRPFGFDAAVEFPPHPFGRRPAEARVKRLRRRFRGILEDYESLTRRRAAQAGPRLPPGTAASCRRGTTPRGAATRPYVAVDSSPDAYRRWLAELVRQALERADVTEPLVFVNAWNEWAEGTHLEPDDRYGRAWLEATRDGLADGAAAIGEVATPESARRDPGDRQLRQQKLPHGQNLKSAGTSRLNGCDRSLRSTSRARSGPLPRAFETRPWKIP